MFTGNRGCLFDAAGRSARHRLCRRTDYLSYRDAVTRAAGIDSPLRARRHDGASIDLSPARSN